MEFMIRQVNGITILILSGNIDALQADELNDLLLAEIDKTHTNIVIDCTNIEFLGSGAIRALLISQRQCKKANGKLYLCCLPDKTLKILDISGFTKQFEIFDTFDEAEKMMQIEIKHKGLTRKNIP